MIVFNLICANDHRFEGWFASTEDFNQQRHDHLLTCPSCGDQVIEKTPHAPYIKTSATHGIEEEIAPDEQQYVANFEEALTKIADYIVRNTEDVGEAFPEEVRKIHYDETPERKIRGVATQEEVVELREEGIEVVSLPMPAYRLGKAH